MGWFRDINFKNIKIKSKCCNNGNIGTDPPTPREDVLKILITLENQIININKEIEELKKHYYIL